MTRRHRPHRSTHPTSRVPHPRRPARSEPATPSTAWVARSPTDLVALVPQVLGFHPTDSVVVLSFGGPDGFHARADLPEQPGAQQELARLLAGACRTNHAPRAAALLYTDDHARARDQAGLLLEELRAAGVDVVDLLRVHDGRWFRPLHDDEVGTAYDLGTHRFTVRAVYEGRAVHTDRESLRASLRGTDDAERSRLTTAADLRARLLAADAGPDRLGREARWVRDRVREAVGAGEPLDTADAARLLAAVVRGDVRDAAWVDLRRRGARGHVGLWLDLVRRAPDHLLPGPCGLLALAAYLHGDGALAWCAIDRSREVVAHHSLVDLVADLLQGAVPPSAWPEPSARQLPLLHDDRAS